MKFKGTVIIVDPCNCAVSEEDWQKCGYGENMAALGFTDSLYIDNGGEYGCKLIDTASGKVIGGFCTDSSVLTVLYFDELLKYNPDFSDHIDHPDSCAVIKDFDGEIEVDEENYSVIGKGNINFKTADDDEDEPVKVNAELQSRLAELIKSKLNKMNDN